MVNVISEDLLKEIEGSGTKVHNLTDVKEIDKLQYLIKAYEDTLRIFYTKYGLADHGSSKMAQQTVDEVNGDTSSAFTLALNMLYYRRKMIDDVNEMFGTDIVVHFSPAWELAYQKFILESAIHDEEYLEDVEDMEDESENGSEDESEDSTENESEDESEDSTEDESEDESEEEDKEDEK